MKKPYIKKVPFSEVNKHSIYALRMAVDFKIGNREVETSETYIVAASSKEQAGFILQEYLIGAIDTSRPVDNLMIVDDEREMNAMVFEKINMLEFKALDVYANAKLVNIQR